MLGRDKLAIEGLPGGGSSVEINGPKFEEKPLEIHRNIDIIGDIKKLLSSRSSADDLIKAGYKVDDIIKAGVNINDIPAYEVKTVYDPTIFTDGEIYDMGRKALDPEVASGNIGARGKVTGEFNGIKFEGFLASDGTYNSFYPVLPKE